MQLTKTKVWENLQTTWFVQQINCKGKNKPKHELGDLIATYQLQCVSFIWILIFLKLKKETNYDILRQVEI